MISLAILIQRAFALLFQTLVSCVRIVFLSKFFCKFPLTKQNKECVVLGNGPSLTETIKIHSCFLEHKDLFAVNMFANSDYYLQLKPRYYVILAPELWTDKPSERIKTEQTRLFENIAKANWEMYLYAPVFARKSKFWKKYISNSSITMVWFNPTPIEGIQCINHLFYSLNLGMPRPHNIVTPSLMIAIAHKYSNIYLAGADHSWMKELYVSNTNEVYLTQKHFYDEQTAKAAYMYTPTDSPRRLHEILHKFMCAFASYFEIRKYAESKKINILNATPNSFVDAFDRYEIQN